MPAMHRFKAKMMIHFTYTPQFSFLNCLNQHPTLQSNRDRALMYHKFCNELAAEGMIDLHPGAWDYAATDKGALWVEAALSTPLPIRAWAVPDDVTHSVHDSIDLAGSLRTGADKREPDYQTDAVGYVVSSNGEKWEAVTQSPRVDTRTFTRAKELR
jgi:hypothetical protein